MFWRADMRLRSVPKLSTMLLVVWLITLAMMATAGATGLPLTTPDFVQAAAQGFGDRNNSVAWSMAWFKGKLYVGTGRATQCVQRAILIYRHPWLKDWFIDPDIQCTEDSYDLPLQAEIWRWTPETGAWDRVFQSPKDAPIPGTPGKFVARDIGYRDMLVFTEPDGTEALYVGGVSARSFQPGVPPPRILRSTDGEIFTPIPQQIGTFLGDTKADGFRSLVAYKGRLYAIASVEYLGQGPLIEASNPAGGNDTFRQVTPASMMVYEAATFDNDLYLGSADEQDPFTVWKTNAIGRVPYALTAVVTDGGFRSQFTSKAVVSMYTYNGRLYVGTDYPAELLRVNPDDTWDLIVGTPRDTPFGYKEPLSSMSSGFDNPLNIHLWRIADYNGVLYVGSMDQSSNHRTLPVTGPVLEPILGFDLYASPDGINFSMITRTGFGDKFNTGVRTLVPTAHGLFLGVNNYFYGTTVWRTMSDSRLVGIPSGRASHLVYLPLLMSQGASAEQPHQSPIRVQGEAKDGKVILSWDASSETTQFHVFRSEFVSKSKTLLPILDPVIWIPGPFTEIGTTQEPFFVDTTAASDRIYHYYIVGQDRKGMLSYPSTIARLPSLSKAVTCAGLLDTLSDWSRESPRNAQGFQATILPALVVVQTHIAAGNLEAAMVGLQDLQQRLTQEPNVLDPWRAEDLTMLLDRLIQRVELARLGVLTPADLLDAPSASELRDRVAVE